MLLQWFQEIELDKVLDGSQPGSVIVLHVAQSALQRAQLQAQHEAQKARHLLLHQRRQQQLQAHLVPAQAGGSPSFFNRGGSRAGMASMSEFGHSGKASSFRQASTPSGK